MSKGSNLAEGNIYIPIKLSELSWKVIPDAQDIKYQDRVSFIEKILQGIIDERGYCPLRILDDGTEVYLVSDFLACQSITLIGYADLENKDKILDYNSELSLNYIIDDCGKFCSMRIYKEDHDIIPIIDGLNAILIQNAIFIDL